MKYLDPLGNRDNKALSSSTLGGLGIIPFKGTIGFRPPGSSSGSPAPRASAPASALSARSPLAVRVKGSYKEIYIYIYKDADTGIDIDSDRGPFKGEKGPCDVRAMLGYYGCCYEFGIC